MGKFFYAMLVGHVVGLVGIGLACFLAWLGGAFEGVWTPGQGFGRYSADFARRWDGTCTGWSRFEAVRHMIGGAIHWIAYAGIAIVFWRLHPSIHKVKYSRFTLALISTFIFGCGILHLIQSTTVIYPVYRLEGDWMVVNGLISYVSYWFVAYALVQIFREVQEIEDENQRTAKKLQEVTKRDEPRAGW